MTPDPALLEAVDGLICHAVEFAGLRLRRKLPRRDRWRALRLPAAEVHVHIPVDREHLDRHSILEGAFDRVPVVAERFGLDQACLRGTVEDYVRDLLVAGQWHTYDHVAKLLRTPCLATTTGKDTNV